MDRGSQPPGLSLRFPRSSRLKSPLAIRRIFKEGSRWRGHGLSIHTMRHTGGDVAASRFAIVVSRQLGPAHRRNRLRRRIREAIRLNRPLWPPDTDVVIRPFSDRAATVAFDQLRVEMGQSLQRIRKTEP